MSQHHAVDLAASHAIDLYVSSRLPADVFAAVRPFATAAAHALELDSVTKAKNAVRDITRLAAWCLEVGIPLERGRVFDPDTVERFVEDGLADASEAVRRTYRPNLRRYARILEPRMQPPVPERLPRPRSPDPYSDAEVHGLLRLADNQYTALRRRRTTALLCLGLGAGLQSGEYQHVRSDDVACQGGNVLVDVRGRYRRTVPLLEPFGHRLFVVSIRTPDEFLLGGDPCGDRRNAVWNVTSGIAGAGDLPRIEVGRMRAWWLSYHLRHLGLDALLAGAGLTGSQAIFDLVARLPRASDDAIVARLSGSL